MIDLTPLDVRNKRGDFKKLLRGYDPQEVDTFLDLVAERLEALVRENIGLRERSETLQQQVNSQSGRERAVQEALVTAQELRSDIRAQAQREAELILAEARSRAKELEAEAEHRAERNEESLAELERRRLRFLKTFRQLLERELDVVEVEEGRAPLEDQPIEIELGGGSRAEVEPEAEEEPAPLPGLEEAMAGTPPPVGPFDGDERPPLDAAIDELAAAHEAYAVERPEPDGSKGGDLKSARELVLPIQEEITESEGEPHRG